MLRTFLLRNTLVILLILSIEMVIGEVNILVPGFNTSVFSANAVAMLATVVGIFLVFIFNNAYQRWWEARTLWGQLVNASRNFGRQVSTLLTHIDTTLNLLTDVQGGCERIKTTVFPSMVRAMSTVFVWGTATLIPIVFLEPDQSVRPVEFCAVFFICRALIVVKQLGFSLMDTFENADNDIPMTALCRTIERDLRGQLGESNLPPSIQPSKGVLL